MASTFTTNPLVPELAVGADEGDGRDLDFQESTPPLTLDALPDLVLEALFKVLPAREQGRLARTCHTMNSVMLETPSLWFNASIHLKCDGKMSKKEIRKIRANLTFIAKHEEHFQNIEVVLRSLRLSASAVITLRRFAEKGIAIKRVKVVINDLDDIMNLLDEPDKARFEEYDNFECRRCGGILKHKRKERFIFLSPLCDLDGRCDCREPIPLEQIPEEAEQMRELLSTNTHIILQMGASCSSSRVMWVEDSSPQINEALDYLYSCSMTSKFSRTVHSLVLPEISHEETLPNESLQNSQTPTAVLMTRFPNLQELCLSFHNTSENLFRELSSIRNQRRAPLKKLTLLHKDYGTTIDERRSFPSVLGSTWHQLKLACPELMVECHVRVTSEWFPALSDSIKPETPLVRVEATVSSEDIKKSDTVSSMKILCQEHCCPFLLLVAGTEEVNGKRQTVSMVSCGGEWERRDN